MTDDIMNQLIWCEINEEMKNFSNHLSIQTIINLRVCKKLTWKSRCNWKTMNEEKFINILKEQTLKSLLNYEMRCQCINEYIKQLLNALKKIIEIFTLWAKSHEMIKVLRVCRDWIEFSSQQALEVLTHVESLASTLYSSAFDTWANLLRSLCFALL